MSAEVNELDFGVIRGVIREKYSLLWQKINRDNYNFIGLYKRQNFTTTIYLYRNFDGTGINYFGDGVTIERLSKHFLIERLTLNSFSLESWEVDGTGGPLIKRFGVCIAKNMMETATEKNYDELLSQTFGLTEGISQNGYYRVNDIIMKMCNLKVKDYTRMSKDLIDCKYLNLPVEIDCSKNSIKHDPSQEIVDRESSGMLGSTLTIFGSLCDNSNFFSKIMSLLDRDDSDNVDLNELENHLDKIDDKTKTMLFLNLENKFKNDVSDLKTFIVNTFSGENIVIKTSELVYRFNMLALRAGVAPISSSEINDNIVASKMISVNERIEPLDITLKNGNRITLTTSFPHSPVKTASLLNIPDEDLRDILRYVLALRNTNQGLHLNNVIDCIVEELSSRDD